VNIRLSVTLTFALCTLQSALAAGPWHGVYDDAPLAVKIRADRASYHIGDTFRIWVTATSTSDRPVLLRRNWKEQLVFYHIHPTTGEQIEWPGRINNATWLDSTDVVRLKPGASYSVLRLVRVFIEDDVSTFEFRVKLCGVKDYGRKFDTWQGEAWSNAIKVTVTK